jgi:hypothetical protein
MELLENHMQGAGGSDSEINNPIYEVHLALLVV